MAPAPLSRSPGHDRRATTSDTNDLTQLQPPQVTVLKNSRHLADGLIFIGPKPAPGATAPSGQTGPEIIDNQGRPVWFNPIAAPDTATDFRVQQYHGQPVLTYAVGRSTGGPGHSEGYDVILNRHYQQIATVEAGNGLAADQHEFALTPQGTALITIYHQVPYDLSSVGGPSDGSVLDGVVQEIDVATGNVLFEWHSLDHVPLERQLPAGADRPPATPYDYFHINSVNLDNDGNLLISARHTWTVYKVDRHTGHVIWRLGGKESDFQLGPGVQFAWQHNALPEGPNTIRIFDNESTGPRSCRSLAGDLVHLDLKAKTATLVSSIAAPGRPLGGLAGQRAAAARRPHVRRLGPARALLGVRLQRQPALGRRPPGRLRHLPRLPLALGRAPRHGSHRRGGALRRQPRHGRRDLERGDRGRPLGRSRRLPPVGPAPGRLGALERPRHDDRRPHSLALRRGRRPR